MEDPALHADMLANIGRPGTEVLYAGTDGVVLLIGGWLVSATAREPAFYEKLRPLIPADVEDMTVHQSFLADAAIQSGRFRTSHVMFQVLCEAKEPLPVHLPPNAEIRTLTEADAPVVQAHYRSFNTDETYALDRIQAGMIGVFVDGKLAGFMGTHDERSMGLLVVLPEYRRHHIAEAMECAMINLRMQAGEVAYGQVNIDNEASLALQRKLGMTISKTPVYWVY